MYPIIIIAKELSTDTTDMINVGALIDIIEKNKYLNSIFDDCLEKEIFTIFIAKDRLCAYRKYLFLFDYDTHNNFRNIVVGKI